MSEIQRAVIYARFSSDMQREESIEAQVRACKEYCRKKLYVVTNIYVDEAKSARDVLKRDAYNQMLADAIAHKFDVIIFHKIDRNARNEFNYYSFKHTLSQLGIGYEYAAQNIDFTPEGQMMENMLVGFAAYYSRNLAKETKKGLNENAYKAQFNGGKPPLGYKIVDKRYVIDPYEAEAVKMIFSMYLDGYGYGKIAEKLKLHGYHTKDGRNFGKNSLYDILSNEKYIGTYTFNKTSRKAGKRNMHAKHVSEDVIRIENALPAIITKDDFYRVQEKKKANRHRAAAYTAKEEYLLSGKVFCGCCGSSMAGHRYKPREKVYSYYACLKKERVAGSRCPQKQIRRELLEKWVLDHIASEILSEKNIETYAKLMLEEYNKRIQDVGNNVQHLKIQKIAAEKKLNNLYIIIENGAADEFDIQRIKKVKEELSDINKKLDELADMASYPEVKVEVETMCNLLRKYKNLFANSKKAKKILIETCVKKVTINRDIVTLELTDDSVSALMVPRTGIEPVRVSLPEGF